jgi:galactokinase
VNLIGEHTDYSGGLAMPIAIELGTTVIFEPGESDDLILCSSAFPGEVNLSSSTEDEHLVAFEPSWARYAAGVVARLRPAHGGRLTVSSDLPIGAGLSSSASFEIAMALALGSDKKGRDLAVFCQEAEELAFGGRTGLLDQVASVFGQPGKAMVIDFSSLELEYVAVPSQAELVVVHSGLSRQVAATAYGERTRECTAAEAVIGPLHMATPGDEEAIRDAVIRRRARHVISENARVRAFSDALSESDLESAGKLLRESHESLAGDYEVSVPALDQLVSYLCSQPGVYGARLTGAGFGGCVLSLGRPGALRNQLGDKSKWIVTPSLGARLLGLA